MNFTDLLLKTYQLELEYLKNPNTNTAKQYNKAKNELCKNKSFYNLLLKTNIEGLN